MKVAERPPGFRMITGASTSTSAFGQFYSMSGHTGSGISMHGAPRQPASPSACAARSGPLGSAAVRKQLAIFKA